MCSPMSILLFSVMYGSERAEDDLGCWCWGKKAVVEAQQGPAFNRAAEHRSDLSAGLSPLTDTDGEVTGATNLACYMQDPDFGYQDFARRDEDQTQVFRVQVRFLLSRRAAVRAATSPLRSWWGADGCRGAHAAHIWCSCFCKMPERGSSAPRGDLSR